jgi:nicotinamide mononucleotide transporter
MTYSEVLTVIEWLAMASLLLSVWLAARHHIATWPIGIVACVLYGILFFQVQLYADATLQVFFIFTSVVGWWNWRRMSTNTERRAAKAISLRTWGLLVAVGTLVTLGYGSLLHRWTDAFAPFWDSAVLTTSVVAQILLMQDRRETWPVWILVNTLSVPLYLSRGLDLTAALYTVFWFNAWYGWWRWGRTHHAPSPVRPDSVESGHT